MRISTNTKPEVTQASSRYLACGPWMAVAKLSGPHWNALSIPPFIVAVLAAGSPSLAVLAVGTLAAVCLSAIIDLTNRIADRVEDAVDYPYRTPMCERVGYRTLWIVVGALSVGYAVCVAVLGTLEVPLAALLTWAGYYIYAINYSYGLRLKTRRFGSWFAVAAYPSYFLLIGGVQSGDVCPVLLPALLLWIIGLTLVGWKDVNNLAGDEAVGFRSVVRLVLGGSNMQTRSTVVVMVPYALVAALVIAGVLPERAWALFLLVPLAIAYAIALPRIAGKVEAEAVRETGNLYFLGTTLVMCWIILPAVVSVIVGVAALAWWILTTHYVNCDPPGLTRRHVRAFVGLLIGEPEPARGGQTP